MRAALVRRHGMDLVDDHGPRGRQHLTAGLRAEQDVERFRRGDDDVRRAAAHALALARRRVAGAHPGADVHVGQALRLQRFANAGQRRFQIAVDVVRQRLERRDVDDLGLVREAAVEPLPHQRVDRREKCRQRLAGAGRRGDQHVAAGLERRPRLRLRRGGRGEALIEPGGDGGMKHGTGLTGSSAGAAKVRWQAPKEQACSDFECLANMGFCRAEFNRPPRGVRTLIRHQRVDALGHLAHRDHGFDLHGWPYRWP